MKLAASNIAWAPDQDRTVAALLKRLGYQAVEIAPTKYWSDLRQASEPDVRAVRAAWESAGFPVVAIQSLLFGRPQAALFGAPVQREEMFDALRRALTVGRWLGARLAVFGSPKNRRRGAVPPPEAERIAAEFFTRIAEEADDRGMVFCIEPNPGYYDCDFVTTSREGEALVRRVNRSGFGLHLDAAAMTLAQEPMPDSLVGLSAPLCHFHASEPDLAPAGTRGVDHRLFADALRRKRYDGWVSVEMREPANLAELENALSFVRKVYG